SNGDRFTFAGFELDPVIGLALNGARWYSFDIGRWWSEDPIEFDGGQANLRVYVGNNPANGQDPSGLDRIEPGGLERGSPVYWWVQRDGTDHCRLRIGQRGELQEVILDPEFGPGIVDLDRLVALAAEFPSRSRPDLSRAPDGARRSVIRSSLEGIRRPNLDATAIGGFDPTAADRRDMAGPLARAMMRSVVVEVSLGAISLGFYLGPPQGFSSFDTLKRFLGPAGDGRVWHHIVEQRGANITRFGATVIHNTRNVVAITRGANEAINRYYSSIRSFTGGRTVRAWLGTQTLAENDAFGRRILAAVLSNTPLPP
ncbi:MAG: RHS repeat-associated core domain-containing protein, partial [Gemmataceae bacterium]